MSFLYNGGTPSGDVDELVKDITELYFQERIHVLRTLIPLFRAHSSSGHAVHKIATKFLPKIIPDAAAESLIKAYVRKTQQTLPFYATTNPKAASLWAKQIAKEQLVHSKFSSGPCTMYRTASGENLRNSMRHKLWLPASKFDGVVRR